MEITVDSLTKKYPDGTLALSEVSFTLTEGIYGLLGPNGSGKSTLMNILTQNLIPTGGTVTCDGNAIDKMGASYRASLGYVPQQQALYPDFTAYRFLSYMAALQGLGSRQARESIERSLTTVELLEFAKKKISTFSGGMKQRLLIASAIVADPKILIMDEPTAGLDPKQRSLMRALIEEVSQNKIVLIATHVVSDVELVAGQILLLRQGSLIRMQTPSDLIGEVSKTGKPPINPSGHSLEDVFLHFFGDTYDKADIL